MDASYVPLLRPYSACAIAVSEIGVLTSLPCSARPACWWSRCSVSQCGADGRCHHPLKVLPVCYRFLAESEPLRRITGGPLDRLQRRPGGTGLDRGWVRMTVGLIAAARFGFGSDGLVPAGRG
ncbi:hypothetical protein G5C60_09305 [Streptomyces sp. HC44]|uniref:Uncharacterized protein n=1 Tax=Streptomyces scabichelini TaxID=2711217 RepID=A0A6G4V1N8_9ACTN|nr:hypothetical protein [Streptomyces scabichelini]NGO07845.1 hypothetical protein [Streptomyces scabichelini]